MNTKSALNTLLAKPLFKAADARKLGMHPSLIDYYVKKHVFERIGRGVYRGAGGGLDVDFQWEDLVLTVKSVPNGIVCLVSALALYEITDEIPRTFWIAIPHSTTIPKRKGAKFIRMRDTEIGLTEFKIGNETIPIFDMERTIIDAFRCLSKEIAIKALKESLKTKRTKKLDLKKLRQYAYQFNLNLDPYILAVTT